MQIHYSTKGILWQMELGLFEIKESTVMNADGSVRLTRTPKVTGKGQLYFVERYLGKKTANE